MEISDTWLFSPAWLSVKTEAETDMKIYANILMALDLPTEPHHDTKKHPQQKKKYIRQSLTKLMYPGALLKKQKFHKNEGNFF